VASRAGTILRERLQRHVRASGDRRLERTVGSRPALRLLLIAVSRRFDPAAAAGYTGAIRLELSTSSGEPRVWALAVGDRCRVLGGARAARVDSELQVRCSVADLVRLAAGELGPGRALLTGRLDFAGDFGLARRAGPMFGVGSAL
jgi:hypothetical protein